MSDVDKTKKGTDIGACREIAPDVFYMEVGKGIDRSNVYFLQSGPSWVLIDTASVNCSGLIRQVAESVFGVGRAPFSILLTHNHPDHAGSALELARLWNCRVYVHRDELLLATQRDLATVEKFANPMDRWIILPLLRIMPRRRVDALLLKGSLKGVVLPLDPGGAVPGLPSWEYILVPGHSPGQVAFFRSRDRVLITGDAVFTADINSFWGFLQWALRSNKPKICPPPWYSTWNKSIAKESISALAKFEPRVLATGHGVPMIGDGVAQELHAFADRFASHSATKG
jgi:glyoxylase-like metal-dependent hydrolase (beta-lactamase superfamily II)